MPRGSSRRVCIAGRDPLDEAVYAMSFNFSPSVTPMPQSLPTIRASRERIALLNMEAVSIMCVTYLELSGSPAHLRFLVRRLRARANRAIPIVVGLWSVDDEVLKTKAMEALIGADYYTTSLRETVEICIRLSHAAAFHDTDTLVSPGVSNNSEIAILTD